MSKSLPLPHPFVNPHPVANAHPVGVAAQPAVAVVQHTPSQQTQRPQISLRLPRSAGGHAQKMTIIGNGKRSLTSASDLSRPRFVQHATLSDFAVLLPLRSQPRPLHWRVLSWYCEIFRVKIGQRSSA